MFPVIAGIGALFLTSMADDGDSGAFRASGYSPRFEFGTFKSEADIGESLHIIRIMLDALTAVDAMQLRNRPNLPPLYQSGIRYERIIPPGEDDDPWQDAVVTYLKKKGDCEDLGCLLAAEFQVRKGINAIADFRWRWHNNKIEFHVFTRLPDGRIIDPSKDLGMKGSY